MQGNSRIEESELPLFNSYDEAIHYFEEHYGEKFVFEESGETVEGMFSYYRLIMDEAAYLKGAADLNANGSVGLDFLKSYQLIQIREDGSIKLGH